MTGKRPPRERLQPGKQLSAAVEAFMYNSAGRMTRWRRRLRFSYMLTDSEIKTQLKISNGGMAENGVSMRRMKMVCFFLEWLVVKDSGSNT